MLSLWPSATPGTAPPRARTAAPLDLREIATDAVAYWERRRPLYNAVLTTVVAAVFVAWLPRSLTAIGFRLAIALFALAVFANVAYCAAYVPDVIAQCSAWRDDWRRRRWVLFTLGCWFAAIVTWPVTTVLLAVAGHGVH